MARRQRRQLTPAQLRPGTTLGIGSDNKTRSHRMRCASNLTPPLRISRRTELKISEINASFIASASATDLPASRLPLYSYALSYRRGAGAGHVAKRTVIASQPIKVPVALSHVIIRFPKLPGIARGQRVPYQMRRTRRGNTLTDIAVAEQVPVASALATTTTARLAWRSGELAVVRAYYT